QSLSPNSGRCDIFASLPIDSTLTLSINDQQIAILENITNDSAVLEQIDFQVTGANYLPVTEDNYDPGQNRDYLLLGDVDNNFMVGSDYNDVMAAYAGHDTLVGGAGNDSMSGFDDNDILHGDEGDDSLRGGIGDDTLNGGAGVDSLVGGADADIFVFRAEDSSTDTIQDFKVTEGDSIQVDVEAYYNAFNDVSFDYAYSGTDLTLTFSGQDIATLENIASDDIADVFKQIEFIGTVNTSDTSTSVDILIGNANNNPISALTGNDYIYGGDGNDPLVGGGDDDVILGGNGNDVLRGSAGNDILIGGNGADRFLFRSHSAVSGSDRILDFTSAEGDVIEIDQSGYGISSLNEVSFNGSNGELSINSNILATLENYDTFAVNSDVVLV
ncbi:calcium-binding protein, partial [Crocosphaera sp. Alani8]|uniref:calcium-binding protein n=1 Tax=Crocosphaera sp. Alani8 TaxID=3038952 RepID=UPI00313B14A6